MEIRDEDLSGVWFTRNESIARIVRLEDGGYAGDVITEQHLERNIRWNSAGYALSLPQFDIMRRAVGAKHTAALRLFAQATEGEGE